MSPSISQPLSVDEGIRLPTMCATIEALSQNIIEAIPKRHNDSERIAENLLLDS